MMLVRVGGGGVGGKGEKGGKGGKGGNSRSGQPFRGSTWGVVPGCFFRSIQVGALKKLPSTVPAVGRPHTARHRGIAIRSDQIRSGLHTTRKESNPCKSVFPRPIAVRRAAEPRRVI